MTRNISSSRFATLALAILSLLATLASSGPRSAPGPTSDISLKVTQSRAVLGPGQQVTFTVTMHNLGPDDAVFVDVGLQLPAGLQLVSMTCDLGISPDGSACEYSSLPAGSTVITLATAVAAIQPSGGSHFVKTVAQATFENADSFDPHLANNRSSVRTRLVAGR